MERREPVIEQTSMHAIGLDFVIVQVRDSNQFQVWTPDLNGAVVGSGLSKDEAVKNAIQNLGAMIALLTHSL